MATDHVRTLIEVALVNDSEDPRIAGSFEALGVQRGSLVVSATFALAVMKRFPDNVSLETVRDFTKSARARLAETDQAPQLFVEALIRSILGEVELAREVPKEMVLPIQSWLIYLIVHQLYPTADGRREFVDEATINANDWLDEAAQL